MTELQIIKLISQWLDERKYPFQICNSFVYQWESDYWAMTSEGETREFEIKVSRSDFFRDDKKKKHTESTGANFFYYVCPTDLIKPSEIDIRYGLIYVKNERLQLIKKPRRLHDNLFTSWKMLANKMYWRYRNLWREKYITRQITRSEYMEGFNIQLDHVEK